MRMTFKEFSDWCNERACDGCWGMQTAIFCINVMNEVNKQVFWKKEKKWQELNADDCIVKGIVEPINQKIAKMSEAGNISKESQDD